MGTVVSFSIHVDATAPWRAGLEAACADLHHVDEMFSTWRPESPLSRLRRGDLDIEDAPAQIGVVLDLCRTARELSAGWFDPWAMPDGVDPTGLVKGWAVERAAAVMARSGVDAVLVNGGGDIATFRRNPPATPGHMAPDQPPWRIGIRHPWRPEGLADVVAVDAAIATSGAYERGEHLIDPATGRAVSAAASATVTGPSLAIADALTTALAVGGRVLVPTIERLAGYEAYVIGWDGTETTTSAFPSTSKQRLDA